MEKDVKDLLECLKAAVDNNSLIEGDDDDNLLFPRIKKAKIQNSKLLVVDVDDNLYGISVKKLCTNIKELTV